MSSVPRILSKNIRFLRKRASMSQEQLAERLQIKRSNIAAYESKNVEPRLRSLLALAKFFDVSLRSLLTADLSATSEVPPFNNAPKSTLEASALEKNKDEFISHTNDMRKILEGFKAYYNFKLTRQSDDPTTSLKELDGFVHLMDHLLQRNESVAKALDQ